jgi:uncharacterized protein YciI
MYVVELAFDDDPARLAARPAHRKRLERLHDDGVVLMAGPFSDDSGALLVFDVADDSALQELLDADPYFRAPGVTVVRARQWAPFLTGGPVAG